MNSNQHTAPAAKYTLSQIFGERQHVQKVHQEDIISVVRFDTTGKYLSIGDNAGRVIIFHQNIQPNSSSQLIQPQSTKTIPYDYYSQFQSHNRQFDTLRSTQIGQTIIDMKWLRPQGLYQKLITSNSRTIKLWKIFEKQQRRLTKSSGQQLAMPKIATIDKTVASINQKTFPIMHKKPINTIDTSNNQEYMLSSDQEQIMFWNLEKSRQPYLLVDKTNGQISQKQFQMLTSSSASNAERSRHRRSIDIPSTFTSPEYITCSKMHPISDSVFLYGTNKGLIRLSDLRVSGNSQNNCVDFIMSPTSERKNFFTEMISSVSSLKFLSNSKYLISRDFLTVKIWDICKTSKPIDIIPVQDSLKTKLCQIFENQCIQDRFMLQASKNSETILTGNFNNCFHLINMNETIRRKSFQLPQILKERKNEVNKQLTCCSNSLNSLAYINLKGFNNTLDQNKKEEFKSGLQQKQEDQQDKQNININIKNNKTVNMQYQLSYKKNTIMKQIINNKNEISGKFDCKRKVLSGDFHPSENIIAVSCLNCFFIYLTP